MKIVKVAQIKREENTKGEKIFYANTFIDVEGQDVIPLNFLFNEIPILYSRSDKRITFDFTKFGSEIPEHHFKQVEILGLEVLIFNRAKDDFLCLLKYLIEYYIPTKKDLILGLLRYIIVFERGDKVLLKPSVLNAINSNLSTLAQQELKCIFSVSDADLFGVNGEIKCVSIHSKNGVKYEDINESDYYLKTHQL